MKPYFISNPRAYAPHLLQKEAQRLKKHRDSSNSIERAAFTPERAQLLEDIEAELVRRPVV